MKTRITPKNIAIVAVSLVIIACTPGEPGGKDGESASAPSKECRIGLVMPTTGGMATYGAEGVLAARIALEHARTITSVSTPILVEEDSASDPTQANEAASTLLGGRGTVHTIIGEINSVNTSAMVSLARESRVPIIAPTASSISLTAMSNNLVRIWPSDSYEATKMLEYMLDEGVSKVAVIYVQVPYGKELAEFFQIAATAAGITVRIEGYPETTADFAPLLSRLRNFEYIYLVSYLEDAALILNQAHKMKARSPRNLRFFGTSVLDSSELVVKAGQAAEGIIFAVVQPGKNGDPEGREKFKSAYVELRSTLPGTHALSEAGKEPGFAGFHVYDAASIAFAACEEVASVGDITGDAMLNYYKTMRPFKGITGQIEFDKNGDLIASREVVFKTVAGGEIKPLQAILSGYRADREINAN